MKNFAVLLVLVFLLNGCARKDPVESMVDNHINHIENVLEYANNNFEQTQPIQFLENELESCMIVLGDIKEAYYMKMDNCESKINYWRSISFGLGLLIMALCILKLKRLF